MPNVCCAAGRCFARCKCNYPSGQLGTRNLVGCGVSDLRAGYRACDQPGKHGAWFATSNTGGGYANRQRASRGADLNQRSCYSVAARRIGQQFAASTAHCPYLTCAVISACRFAGPRASTASAARSGCGCHSRCT